MDKANKAKKDYIAQHDLDKLIISQYREGRTAKSIARDLKHYTIEHDGGLCLEATLSG